jgi:hypothetical protein
MISRFQDGVSFQLNPLVTTFRLIILRRIVAYKIRRYKRFALEYAIDRWTTQDRQTMTTQ